jgi:hypothetical protein
VALAVMTAHGSATGDRPSGYRCAPGKANRDAGRCACPRGFHAGTGPDRVALCKRNRRAPLIPPTTSPPDHDSDGVPDENDRCPVEPEVPNDFEDGDGCPDLAPNTTSTVGPASPVVEDARVAPLPEADDAGLEAASATSPPVVSMTSSKREVGSARRRLAVGVGVAATISFGGAIALELLARNSYDEYIRTGGSERAYDAANRERRAAFAVAAAGVALGVTSVYLWLTAHRGTVRSVVAQPVLGRTVAGASMSLEF